MLRHQFPLVGMRGNTLFLADGEFDAKGLIVLCHGWHGDLTKSWGKLDKVAWRTNRLSGIDLLFVGYRTSPTSLDLLASWLAEILREVYPEYCFAGKKRHYEYLILVGHSLGTLGLRKAILRLYNDSRRLDTQARDICEHSKLVLFAPPLLGVDWQRYLRAIRESWLNWLTPLVSACIDGLEPISADLRTGSHVLAALREATAKILENDPDGIPLAHVILGSADRVIQVDEIDDLLYPNDTHEVLLDGTHISVCKISLDDSTSRVLDLMRTKPPRVAHRA